ncbi:MAG: DUF1028 domain-containing protein [Bacillota bacterium]
MLLQWDSPATFSVVAADVDARQWGVAVQSELLAVGWVVPWAYWDVGAVATGASVNPAFGPRGLTLMRDGLNAEQALQSLLRSDASPEIRQVGLVDRQGLAAAHTGDGCGAACGDLVGDGYCCQGSCLQRPEVLREMADCFEGAGGQLADRLMDALVAGREVGRGRREQRSAALYVVAEHEGYGGLDHRYVDLRIDDADEPAEALSELLFKFKVSFHKTGRGDIVPWTFERRRQLLSAPALEPYLERMEVQPRRQLQAALSRLARDRGVHNPELDAGIDGRLWRLLG